MVHRDAGNRSRYHLAQGIIAALAFAGYCCAASGDSLLATESNTVHISVFEDDEIISRGSGILLGTIGNRAYLYTATHVVSEPGEIGDPDTSYSIKLELEGAVVESGFDQARVYTRGSNLKEMVSEDFIIFSLPVDSRTRHLIYPLNQSHFKAPHLESEIAVSGRTRYGNRSRNFGKITDIGSPPVIEFHFKTDDIVENGDSGSFVYSTVDEAINGLLISTNGRTSQGVYPQDYLTNALEDIMQANAEKEFFVGWSIALAPTYQIANETTALGGDIKQSRQREESYTSLDFELIGARSIKGKDIAPKLGLIFGISDGGAHALGNFDDVEYTIKAGVTLGIAKFSENLSASAGLLLLAHRIDDEYEYEPALSGEFVFSTFKLSPSNTLDIGVRIELNRLDFSDLDDTKTSMGIGLVFKVSWLGIY